MNFTEFAVPELKNHLYLEGMPQRWWKAQLVSFMFRPNKHTFISSLLPSITEIFGTRLAANEPLWPEKLLFTFMREGDKGSEAPLHAPEEYWSTIVRLSERHKIRHVYVSSDSGLAIEKLLELSSSYTPDLKIYFLDYHRLPSGMGQEYLKKNVWGKPVVTRMVHVALTDALIASRAIAWVGTLSSKYV